MPRALLALIALLLLALAAAPAASAAEVTETIRVPTVDGAEVSVEIRRPAEGQVPIILTYSPYNVLKEGGETKDSYGNRYVPQGYARAVADVIGTRNSSGCWDYGGLKEQQSGVDLVKALAAQPWSNGKVAMIGGSYDGTTANMVAARGADATDANGNGLAAIVPIAAISRWYGYAYSHGVRYSGNSQNPTDEGFDTPLAFDFGFGRTPPTDPGAIEAARDRLNECESVKHTQQGYDENPDYDSFWLERDYRKDAAKVQVPALVVHGWQDFNVKQEEATAFYEALPGAGAAFKRLYMFQGTHGSPRDPGFLPLLDAFFAKTLLGQDTGVERGDPVITQGRDFAGAAKDLRAESTWPPSTTQGFDVPLGERTLGAGPAKERSYTDLGGGTEEAAGRNPNAETQWLAYQSEPLTADARIAGEPELALKLRVSRANGHLVPTLFDVDPAGAKKPITRGFLDLGYRDGLDLERPAPVGQDIDATVTFLPQDWTVRKGHRLMVILQSSNTAWAVPDDPGLKVTVLEGQSRLRLPLADGAASGAIPGGTVNGQPAVSGPGGSNPTDSGSGGSNGTTNNGSGGSGSGGNGSGSGAGTPSTPAKPGAGVRLTAKLRRLARSASRRKPGRLRVSGSAPQGRFVLVRLQRRGRTVLTRKVRVRNDRYSITFRVRRGGTYSAIASQPEVRVRTGAARLR